MKMKKLFFIKVIFVTVLILMVAAPAVMADQLTVNWLTGYHPASGQGSNGGEFTLSGNDLVKFQPYYANSTKDQGYVPSIQSFCVELNEFVNIGGTYNFKVSSAAIQGGAGGPSPDPLSRGAAWLYHQFQLGLLEGYDYTAGSGRAASAGALQTMIWFLEDEINSPNWLGSTNPFQAVLFSVFNDDYNNAKLDNNGLYNTAVLTLWKTDNAGNLIDKQDQLVSVPEPATMLLLGSGLLGLAGLARRRFRK